MKKKAILWGTVIVLLLAGAGAFAFRKKPSDGLSYQEIKVARGDLQSKILSTGVVQPENRLEIKAAIPGRAERIFVEEGNVVKKGQRLALMSSTERAALLDVARAKGSEELKRWEQYYQAAPILAPINGTIILRSVEPGQTVTSSDTLLVMSDRLTVKAQVDETDVAQIVLKQRAQIILDAYPDNAVPARVDQIAYDATTVNNVTVYIVDALPDATPRFMRSGMTANVTFFVDSKKNVLRVPSGALVPKDGRSYVLVGPVREGAQPVEKEVNLGLNDGKFAEVVSGLVEGDTVLVPQMKAAGSESSTGSRNPLNPFMGRRPR
ncbi:MAG: HlyD family efflux transporter periplasmic adaptor subunit [Pseudomonadota bacterium]